MRNERNLKRICIVAHYAYGAITGERTGHFGGVERQVSLLAQWLVSRGYGVSLLTWGDGRPGDQDVGGIRVIKMCRRDAGVPGMRFFHPRWTSLNGAMSRADADLYYQNCAEYVTGQVALWCKAKGRRFVYSVASDPDCEPSLPKMETLRERVLYRYGLLRADRVIVQTRKQQKMMKDGFGVDARILPMACPAPPEARMKAANAEGSRKFRILWVGRISRIKRPEMILDIARMIPDVSFEIVGAPDQEDEYSRCLHQTARNLPNVTFHGRLPRDRMPDMFQSASLLCCTSAWEGFPNTFLEAWSYGLPVVSTVDPDGLIGTEGLGAVIGDPASARSAIEKLRRDVEFRKSISENAWRYYLENHTLETVMPKYERTFIEVVRKGERT